MNFSERKSVKRSRFVKGLLTSILEDRFRAASSSDLNFSDFNLDIAEIACLNPNCQREEPHTFVYVNWSNGGFGTFALPFPITEIDKEKCSNFLPTKEVMTLWSQGCKAEWPVKPTLRFPVGTKVQCKIRGAWAYGEVVNHHYLERNWSPLAAAPYHIKLMNGGFVFAPHDNDCCIKLANLRFKVGDRVNCNVNTRSFRGWSYGRVVKLFYFESDWQIPDCAPYQVLLHSGYLIFVPSDQDSLIQSRSDPPDDAPSSPLINYDDYA